MRHLFKSREMLGPMLATEHNLCFFARLLDDLRRWISGSERVDLSWLANYGIQFPAEAR